MITKRILDLVVNLIVDELLTFALGINKKFTKAI